MTDIDHLVWSVPDLEAGVARFEQLSGIRAAAGGSHPGMGTRNALLSLGPATYLEIIGPDHTQDDYRNPRLFRVDDVTEPRLVTWAAKSDDIDKLVRQSVLDGLSLGKPMAGSRTRTDGALLSWTLTDPYAEIADGIVPFFIDWGDTPHPALDAPAGATLTGLRAEHSEPGMIRGLFAALDIDIVVDFGNAPALIATIDTPNGPIALR